MDHMLTPKQAAARAGCGRSSIMRALKSQSLPAIRDNENRWQIDPDALDRWAGHRPDNDRSMTEHGPATPSDTQTDTPETLARLAVAEARLSDALSRVEDLQRERDEWRAQAQALTRQPGWLDRLLGRT
ncbi:helix-turn-helix domain-containing protein [Ketogulonicigenium robustum]|uniref:helix-turn-helix domain-containing protein n=1 Tax=Ketogulonicigenium robustum TaxID=92947 RepID=UPI000A26FBFE